MSGIYIPDMEMPKSCRTCMISQPDGCGWICPIIEGKPIVDGRVNSRHPHCPLVPVPPHGRLTKRIVYRGDVYNAIEAERINHLDGILTDRYKDGFHDGLKRALQILANEVEDAPTVIPASKEN